MHLTTPMLTICSSHFWMSCGKSTSIILITQKAVEEIKVGTADRLIALYIGTDMEYRGSASFGSKVSITYSATLTIKCDD
jgi:hypothetical protein